MPSFGQTGDWLDAGPDIGSAFGAYGTPASSSNLQSFDTPARGISQFDTPSTVASIGQMLSDYGSRKYGDLNPRGQMGGVATGGQATLGGDWVGVDQWSSAIQQASSATGVSAGLISAVMKLESNGDPNAAGAAGVWGPMQVNSGAWGNGPWMSDPVANIQKGAEILKYYLDLNGGNVREALRGYHGYGSDGYTTDQQYADQVLSNLSAYTSKAGGGSAGFGYNSGVGAITSALPAGSVAEWGEFNVPSSNGYYSYGAQYGLNGVNHTGVDVVTNVGSTYYAPLSGTVTCAGTGIGAGADGGGCAAFGYVPNFNGAPAAQSGAGRVELLLDNGAVLIFGHSLGTNLRPGQRVTAGQALGLSGGMNSAHVHLEARVRDTTTPSGWRIVDPRTVLGGGGLGFTGGGTTPNPYAGMSTAQLAMSGQLTGGGAAFPSTANSYGNRWGNAIINAMAGRR